MEGHMKKTIANVVYDTESAELIHKHTVGTLGDSEGYEESLYKTEKGKYAHLCNYAFWKLNKMLKYSFTPSETVI